MCSADRFMNACAALTLTLVLVTDSFGQNAITEDGIFVSVPNPVTSEAVQRVKNQIAPRQNTRPVRTIVFDFNPANKDAANTDFGACSSLAELIRELRANATTVAYLHGKVSGHT